MFIEGPFTHSTMHHQRTSVITSSSGHKSILNSHQDHLVDEQNNLTDSDMTDDSDQDSIAQVTMSCNTSQPSLDKRAACFAEQINEDDRYIIRSAVEHIKNVSFGEEIYHLYHVLENAGHIMWNTLEKSNPSNRHIAMAHAAAVDSADLQISRLKSSNIDRLVFECIFIKLLCLRHDSQTLYFCDMSELLSKYPEFHMISDQKELNLLLSFRNVLAVALSVIPGKLHKSQLINISTRIGETRHHRYVTGSGEKSATRRRVLIYERESGVLPMPRPPRKVRMQIEEVDDNPNNKHFKSTSEYPEAIDTSVLFHPFVGESLNNDYNDNIEKLLCSDINISHRQRTNSEDLAIWAELQDKSICFNGREHKL